MSDITSSPNMNLPVPVVGTAPGPDWASDLNGCLNIIDSHSHITGSGVPITPAALNLISDVPFNIHNATMLRSTRFSAQASPLALADDLNCAYVSGVDLYYNDGNGNQVRLTQSGNVAGTPGSIANLASPASATYVSGNETFVWQSDANTPANLDAGAVIFRNITANSHGITLSAPNALGSNYSLTLPSIPAQTNVMTLANSGVLGSITYDQVGVNMSATGADAIAASMSTTGTTSIFTTEGTGQRTTASTNNVSVANDNLYHTVLSLPAFGAGTAGRYLLIATGFVQLTTTDAGTAGPLINSGLVRLVQNGSLIGIEENYGNEIQLTSGAPHLKLFQGTYNFCVFYVVDISVADVMSIQVLISNSGNPSTTNRFQLQAMKVTI